MRFHHWPGIHVCQTLTQRFDASACFAGSLMAFQPVISSHHWVLHTHTFTNAFHQHHNLMLVPQEGGMSPLTCSPSWSSGNQACSAQMSSVLRRSAVSCDFQQHSTCLTSRTNTESGTCHSAHPWRCHECALHIQLNMVTRQRVTCTASCLRLTLAFFLQTRIVNSLRALVG